LVALNVKMEALNFDSRTMGK